MTMKDVLKTLASEQLKTDLPEVRPGDTVRLSVRVVEGTKERLQAYEGTVIRRRGGGANEQITVRRIASGVGVERTFLIHSPRVDKIEVVRHGHARRAALYFLRDRVGKAASLREDRRS
jgi:large subunit ribosomal protein L19